MGPGSAAHHFVLHSVRGTGTTTRAGDDRFVYVSFTRLWRYHYAMTSPPIRQPVRIIGIDPGLRRDDTNYPPILATSASEISKLA